VALYIREDLKHPDKSGRKGKYPIVFDVYWMVCDA